MNDVFVLHLKLPLSVKGAVLPTPDGDYQVIVNDAYNHETQREIYNHEMRHILLGHLYNNTPLPLAEQQAGTSALLAARIREAEQKGLPLVSAILQPTAPPPAEQPARNAPPAAPCEAVILASLRRAALTNLYY